MNASFAGKVVVLSSANYLHIILQASHVLRESFAAPVVDTFESLDVFRERLNQRSEASFAPRLKQLQIGVE